jgi:hypothetical protein
MKYPTTQIAQTVDDEYSLQLGIIILPSASMQLEPNKFIDAIQSHFCVVKFNVKLFNKSHFVQVFYVMQNIQPVIKSLQSLHIELFKISTI